MKFNEHKFEITVRSWVNKKDTENAIIRMFDSFFPDNPLVSIRPIANKKRK